MTLEDRLESIFDRHIEAVMASKRLTPKICEAANLIAHALRDGKKILTCGNGGSAADAQHFTCELVGRFLTNSQPYSSISLTTDPSTMTALGNDFGYDEVFARQVQALGNPGDVLLAISTSGNSKNVVRAAQEAQERKMKVVALAGGQGGNLSQHSDVCLIVPDSSTPRIQEVHELIVHMLCEIIEAELH